jgi:uncharacterized Zn finger protein
MIKESIILAHVGDKNLERGKEYLKQRSIVQAKKQGTKLKALCHGSQPEPYRLWATLTEPIEASCNCPIGYDGRCKHVAALLLLTRNDPDAITELESLEDALQKRSKDELIQLIKQAISVEPNLENLFELAKGSDEDPFK